MSLQMPMPCGFAMARAVGVSSEEDGFRARVKMTWMGESLASGLQTHFWRNTIFNVLRVSV